MIEVLDLVETCSSPTLSLILDILKKALTITQIVGPIVLIISLTMNIIKLMSNPDDKESKKKILNSIIAILILFFIPIIINFFMATLGDSYTLTACWNKKTEYREGSGSSSKKDDKRKKIIDDGSDGYDTPDPTASPTPTSSTSPTTTTPSNTTEPTSSPSVDGTATSIGDIVFDPNDVTKISNITAAQLTAVLNSAFTKKAKNFIPYVNDLIATEHKYSVNVFFLLGIQAYESGWLTSAVSRQCNNLGGVKSSPRSIKRCTAASNGKTYAYFKSVGDFIDYQGELLHNKYLTPGGSYYYGKSIKAVCTKYDSGRANWTNTVTEISTKLFNTVKKVM